MFYMCFNLSKNKPNPRVTAEIVEVFFWRTWSVPEHGNLRSVWESIIIMLSYSYSYICRRFRILHCVPKISQTLEWKIFNSASELTVQWSKKGDLRDRIGICSSRLSALEGCWPLYWTFPAATWSMSWAKQVTVEGHCRRLHGWGNTKVKLSRNMVTRSVEMLSRFCLLKSRGASIVQLSKL